MGSVWFDPILLPYKIQSFSGMISMASLCCLAEVSPMPGRKFGALVKR